MPFRCVTSDPDMFEDLAAMHIERLGVRPETGAGKVTDVFTVQKEEEECELLAVALRAPRGENLPERSPKEFDLSARALPLPENGIAIWKEFGDWVFALSKGGKLAYGQSTPSRSEAPDLVVAREIRVAMTQLTLQGIQLSIQQIVVWHPQGHCDDLSLFEKTFSASVECAKRPVPRLPQPLSKLLPADVDAERRLAHRRKQLVNAGLAVAALYVLGLGWAGFSLWSLFREQKQLDAQVAVVQPEITAFEDHGKKWIELGPVVDKGKWPVELLYHITRAVPTTGGLRLKNVEINVSDGGEIKIVGEAPQNAPIGQFSLGLKNSRDLNMFHWELPPAEQTNKGVWSFTYTGTSNTAATP